MLKLLPAMPCLVRDTQRDIKLAFTINSFIAKYLTRILGHSGC